MQTIIKLFFIAAVLFLGYTIATADGPLVNVTTDSPQPPAPQVIFIPAPEPAQTAVPQTLIVIPNPPNTVELMDATAEAAIEPPAMPEQAVFTLTTGEWVNDANAQYLTDCAHQIAKGLAHDPACPADAAALLGVGR